MSVGVMKDYKLNKRIYASPIHWVGLGTGTPKDKDEVNKREVCECGFILFGWGCLGKVASICFFFKKT
jgi:hypothetical protein